MLEISYFKGIPKPWFRTASQDFCQCVTTPFKLTSGYCKTSCGIACDRQVYCVYWQTRLREGNNISNCNCSVYDFESNYLDLEIKARHEAGSVLGHEMRGMALKQRCAGVVKWTQSSRDNVNRNGSHCMMRIRMPAFDGIEINSVIWTWNLQPHSEDGNKLNQEYVNTFRRWINIVGNAPGFRELDFWLELSTFPTEEVAPGAAHLFGLEKTSFYNSN